MAGTLGTISGQLKLDARQAIAAYAAVRAANAATLYAMRGGSAVFIASGKAMAAVGLGLAAGIGVAVKAAADFEKRLDFFGAVSASTEQQMEAVRKKALQLGQDTIYSANQIADSFVELGKAGVSAEQIVDGVGEAVANLGAAADIPLDRAAQIITSAVQTFSLSAQDAVHVSNLLAGAANASIVEIEDLGVSMKYVGGVAASISLPISDVIDALALLGKYGIRGSTAGTSLRQILVSLTGTSKKAEGVLKDLGIITEDGANKFFTAEGKAKSLSEIFQILHDATSGLTEAQRLAAFKTIFNNRALAAANVLAREGADGFAQMNAEIGKTTAADVASKRLDNLSGDIEILKGNLETLFIQAGTPFQEFLRGIVQGLTRVVQWFGNLDASTQQTILKVIAFSAAFLVVMGAINLMIGTVFRVIAFFLRFAATLNMLWKVVKAGIVVFRSLSIAMMANPIGLIIAAIVALIAIFVVLYKKNETFRNAVNAAAKWIVNAWNAVVAWFKGLPAFFSNLWDSITTGVINAWNSVINFFTVTLPTAIQQTNQRILTFIGNLITGIVTWFQQLPGRVMAFVKMLWTQFLAGLAALPGLVGYWLGFVIGRLIRWGIDMVTAAIFYSMQIRDSIIQFIQELPGRISKFFQTMWKNAVTWLTNFAISAATKSIEIYNSIVNWIKQLPGKIAAFFTDLRNRAVIALVNLVNSARQKASQIVSGIISFISQLPGRVSSGFNDMRNRAVSALINLANSVRSYASRIVSSMINGIQRLPGAVSGIFGRVLSAFRGIARRAVSAARDFASGLWNGFKAGLGIHSPSYIEKAMWQITDVVGTETERMKKQVRDIQRLGNGIKAPEIPAPTAAQKNLIGTYFGSTIDSLSNEFERFQAVQDSMKMTARDIASSSRARTPEAIRMAVEKPSSIALDRTESGAELLGKRNVTVEQKIYNPVEEPTSVSTTKTLTTLGMLGVIG